jgi:phosphatidate cytidylyltransferase
MKKRLLSATVLLLICIPLLIVGNFLFDLAVLLISIVALHEFISIKEERKHLPPFIKLISYIIMTLIILTNFENNMFAFALDYRILAGLFILFLVPSVLYHDREKYSINDAFYMIGGILFLGISLSTLVIIREKSLNLMIYLLLIPIITDTYAYIIGTLIGKTKLLEVISPNKTLEGMIGGTVFGVLIPTIFYYLFVNSVTPIYVITFITLFLSVLGQLGDLVFSAIKRYFSKKDFSNLIPGHGGILDRLDSIIFVVLGFMFFMTIL